jgi:hypothetical protein
MPSSRSLAPSAHLTLRAHQPAPARVELAYKPVAGRLTKTIGWLILCWGSMPLLLWVPPHYPWVTIAFLGGAYLAYRSWTGRYAVHSFAGICPRCGAPLSLGTERTIDLPHTITCFTCHFEPKLEVRFTEAGETDLRERLEHQSGDCPGVWETRWLADVPFLYCPHCHAGAQADPSIRERAEAENEVGRILDRLTDEGRPLI